MGIIVLACLILQLEFTSWLLLQLRGQATQDVPAWVAEMHALSMAAAKHNVQHVGLKTAVYHPPNPPLNGGLGTS